MHKWFQTEAKETLDMLMFVPIGKVYTTLSSAAFTVFYTFLRLSIYKATGAFNIMTECRLVKECMMQI